MNESWLIANPIPNDRTSCNKDLNGGYGTCDEIGDSLFAKVLAKIKKKSIKLPVLTLAYITSILKSKGKHILYSENPSKCLEIVSENTPEVCLIYGSIVASKHELELIKKIRIINDKIIIIIIVGTYPTKFPNSFSIADCVVLGEPEDFFLNWDGNLKHFRLNGGTTYSQNISSLDVLPNPDFSEMQTGSFSYAPMLKGPTGFIESSRGCPFSCGYYCNYGENQGK
tara:strand:+ start:27 stop:704 length:678 start_codon:yes stop_codon:yes gene_type:complete